MDVRKAISTVVSELDAASVGYVLIGDTGLFVQGVKGVELSAVEVSVQWDQFADLKAKFAGEIVEEESGRGTGRFTVVLDGVPVHVVCFYNTVVATDIHRVAVEMDGLTVYAKSLYYFRRVLEKDDPRQVRVTVRLAEIQQQYSALNAAAWSENPYDAWVSRYGTPDVAVERIRKDPMDRLRPLGPYLGGVEGKKVVNLLGSHGSKAVAMALLGARHVTVVDVSPENARYARELAAAGGVEVEYVVSDVLAVGEDVLSGDYDVALMELGILHYFVDLKPLMEVVAKFLRPGGRLVLHDFHPISTKLITSKGKKHKVTGNYFTQALDMDHVAYSKLLEGFEAPKVYLRKWTLGEVVSAVAEAGLFVRVLDEEPNTKKDDVGLPKTYTLVAEKM
ncbi:class I SAM-dependent methyltransferase [Tumebacillus sp. DT12]|uniref:Class I SAM-dependent methyltransferase n=1 Tax=Tumebacillus lacus TaxID=2995335 RepID=A0ABT3WZQ2_9BACL|nr:class I SAM-dependent methyltransferase [Tumebacillus lacus]MCX7570133.1 class I SAM-dependent methyltransferase [Tumebacillus lacus]